MSGIAIKLPTKEKIAELSYNITMLRSLNKDVLIGIIIGINEERQRRE